MRTIHWGIAVVAVVWLASPLGCSGSSRKFGESPSGGTAGQASSTAGRSGAGDAGTSAGSNSEGGADDSGGAAGDGGDSSQGGDSQAGGGAGGRLSNGGAPTGGTSAGGAGGSAGGSSGCGTACASYQFCVSNKCLPTYGATRVLPATDQVNGSGQVHGAVVLANKAQGDLVVQLSGELNLYDPGASMQTTLVGAGYARYTADGKLAWFRSRDALTGSTNVSQESAIVLVPPTDVALSYVKYDAATGPVAGTYSWRLARLNGNSGNLTWEAKYPTYASGGRSLFVVPRPTQGDFLTFYPSLPRELPGQACRGIDNGASATVTCSGSAYAIGAVPGADGTTAWIWAAPGNTKSHALNPLSADTWPVTSNPYQHGGEDAFIVGVRSASTTVGPWTTEGDYGPGLVLAALPGGDLAVSAQGNGYMTFNGGQSLLSQSGSVLFRLNTNTGQILWRTPLPEFTSKVIAAPGGRIAVLVEPGGGTASVQLFGGANGALLTTLPLPPTSYPVLAAGETDLFVLGDYSSAADFDPGPGTDKPTSSRGVYISRYSF